MQASRNVAGLVSLPEEDPLEPRPSFEIERNHIARHKMYTTLGLHSPLDAVPEPSYPSTPLLLTRSSAAPTSDLPPQDPLLATSLRDPPSNPTSNPPLARGLKGLLLPLPSDPLSDPTSRGGPSRQATWGSAARHKVTELGASRAATRGSSASLPPPDALSLTAARLSTAGEPGGGDGAAVGDGLGVTNRARRLLGLLPGAADQSPSRTLPNPRGAQPGRGFWTQPFGSPRAWRGGDVDLGHFRTLPQDGEPAAARSAFGAAAAADMTGTSGLGSGSAAWGSAAGGSAGPDGVPTSGDLNPMRTAGTAAAAAAVPTAASDAASWGTASASVLDGSTAGSLPRAAAAAGSMARENEPSTADRPGPRRLSRVLGGAGSEVGTLGSMSERDLGGLMSTEARSRLSRVASLGSSSSGGSLLASSRGRGGSAGLALERSMIAGNQQRGLSG